MEDLTLALVTIGSFAVLFIVAIFADKAGANMDIPAPEVVEIDKRPTRSDEDQAA